MCIIFVLHNWLYVYHLPPKMESGNPPPLPQTQPPWKTVAVLKSDSKYTYMLVLSKKVDWCRFLVHYAVRQWSVIF